MSEVMTPETAGVGAVNTVPMHEDYVTIDLDTGTVHRSFCDHVICQDNAQGNLFGVKLLKGGEPATVPEGTTCTGYFIRPDGNTVTIPGDVAEIVPDGEGQRAWVVLPQACYAYPGQFTLVINLHKGNYTTTVRIVDGTVVKTRTGTIIDPGIPIPGIDELLSIIAAAQGNTYDASNGVTLSGATFKLTQTVRKHLNTVRHINLGHDGQEDSSINLGTQSPTSGWLMIVWHCGTGNTYGLKFAHVDSDLTDKFIAVPIAINGTDNCLLSFDPDDANQNADPHWTITNTHADAHLRGIVIMSTTSELFC